MEDLRLDLTVFFEDPFWVGIFERYADGTLSVAKVTFGAEPRDSEVYAFLLRHYGSLRFSPAVQSQRRETGSNPKKLQREIRRSLEKGTVGTRSQQALKLQQEQNKLERKVRMREQKQAEAERLFALRQQKKKEKHRGR